MKVPAIIIVGVGPGPWEMLTLEAKDILLNAERVFFRYATHPVYLKLKELGKDIIPFELLYADPKLSYRKAYELMSLSIIKEAEIRGKVVYALPGNPFVFEKTPRMIKELVSQRGYEIKFVPGMSFLEQLYCYLEIDPEEGLVVLNASRMVEHPERYVPDTRLACLIGQVGLPIGSKPTERKFNTAKLGKILMEFYPPSHPAIIVRCTGFPTYTLEKRHITVGEVSKQDNFVNNLTSLYISAVKEK